MTDETPAPTPVPMIETMINLPLDENRHLTLTPQRAQAMHQYLGEALAAYGASLRKAASEREAR